MLDPTELFFLRSHVEDKTFQKTNEKKLQAYSQLYERIGLTPSMTWARKQIEKEQVEKIDGGAFVNGEKLYKFKFDTQEGRLRLWVIG